MNKTTEDRLSKLVTLRSKLQQKKLTLNKEDRDLLHAAVVAAIIGFQKGTSHICEFPAPHFECAECGSIL